VQWGQIKTLFIICFLILNIFLVKQLLDRQDEEIGLIPVTSREEELEFNINGLEDLADETFTAPLIYSQNYNYNQDPDVFETLPDQEIIVVEDYYLLSRFSEPIPFDFEDPDDSLGSYIFRGDHYSYWDHIDSAQVLVYFQKMENTIFYNPNAVLFIHLNDAGEITQYAQTQLNMIGDSDEERTLIQQYDAVFRLYHYSNELQTGDVISDVILGYHNLVSLPNGEQLLNPTWGIQVNEREHHFINAIDGHNYPKSEEFYENSINHFIDLFERNESEEMVFYHTGDEDDEERLLERVRQTLSDVYQNIIEVDIE